MASPIKDRIVEAVKAAMRLQDKPRVSALRLITAAIKQKEVDDRIELTDEHLLALLDKLVKQRRESIDQYKQANRDDLVAQEVYELELIQTFLPTPLTQVEIDGMIAAAIAETGAATMKDMGRVMAILRPQLQGRADMTAVSQQLKSRLP